LVTHDGGVWALRGEDARIDIVGRIVVGDNSSMGNVVTILPEVSITKNCVIGAASVVTKSAPDDTVAAGNPLRFICSFDDYAARMRSHVMFTKHRDVRTKQLAIEGEIASRGRRRNTLQVRSAKSNLLMPSPQCGD
jgi:carbonic anhydrase/acetyltransferase-like protein (isoleucine patch superfamily)